MKALLSRGHQTEAVARTRQPIRRVMSTERSPQLPRHQGGGRRWPGPAAFLLVVGAAVLAPCRAPAATFVYVSNDSSHNVSAYQLDLANGALTPVPGSPFPAGTAPLSVAADPFGRFLYTANRISNNVSGFTIDGWPRARGQHDPQLPGRRPLRHPGHRQGGGAQRDGRG